jgi:hypothetical protein
MVPNALRSKKITKTINFLNAHTSVMRFATTNFRCRYQRAIATLLTSPNRLVQRTKDFQFSPRLVRPAYDRLLAVAGRIPAQNLRMANPAVFKCSGGDHGVKQLVGPGTGVFGGDGGIPT